MGDYESGYDPKLGYNKNAFAHPTPVLRVLDKVNHAIAMPIGLVSEAIHNRKDKKQAAAGARDFTEDTTDVDSCEVAETASSRTQCTSDEKRLEDQAAKEKDEMLDDQPPPYDLLDHDELDWALDDATDEVNEGIEASTRQNIGFGRANLPSSSSSSDPLKLPFPIIIPQRRPGSKARGFVRAYAPVLQNSEIDQGRFLTFLKDFHAHAQASPIFKAVQIASNAAGFYPDPIVMGVCIAINVAASTGKQLQERYRTNKFLDEANKELFMPRGLYAMVVTYKHGEPDVPAVQDATVDIGATAIAKFGSPVPADSEDRSPTRKERNRNRFKLSSGETHEGQMPIECAPLVFPALDAVQDASAWKDEGSKKGMIEEVKDKTRSTSKFVNGYFDRRAQALYAAANPDSTLTKQAATPEFKSRYADPTNHTNMHFITLISGGKIKAEPLGARRRWEKAQQKAAESRAQGLKEQSNKRILQQDILYLTVVNMPTEAELQRARQQMGPNDTSRTQD